MIGTVIQKAFAIIVYNEKGIKLCSKMVDSRDTLVGYTVTSFAVKQGNSVIIYNEIGHKLSAVPY